jgi:hypothetical protein
MLELEAGDSTASDYTIQVALDPQLHHKSQQLSSQKRTFNVAHALSRVVPAKLSTRSTNRNCNFKVHANLHDAKSLLGERGVL